MSMPSAKRSPTKTSTNLIHHATGIKVDLFVAGSLLDVRQLERRRRVHVSAVAPRYRFVHSPEDILLQKLLWYRQGAPCPDHPGGTPSPLSSCKAPVSTVTT